MFEFSTVATAILILYVVLGFKRPGVALTTVLFVAFALGYAAVLTGTEENIIFAPVLFIVTLAVIVASTRGSESQEEYHRWASWLLVAVIPLLLLAVILVTFGAFGAGLVLPLFFSLGVTAIVGSMAGYGITSRRAAVAHVFSTIGSCMRQNLPLPMALDCAASRRGDAGALILRRIKTWLVKGYSLTEAIKRGYPQCPGRVLAMLSAGEHVNQLQATIKAIEADLKSRATERHKLRPVHPAYPVVVLVIMFLIALALMTFVIPQFKAVLDEMLDVEKAALPTSTVILIRISRTIAYDTYPWLWLGLIGLVAVEIWLRSTSRRRRPESPHLLSRIGDALKWYLPIVHWFENNRSMLQVVELLRVSLNAGCTVNDAIRGTLKLDVNLCFRKRLACWLERVERGNDIATAARDIGLGTALAWAFDSGAGSGNTPAVLDILESYYRSNYSYRVNLARFILWPGVVIALGLTVGFVVYAFFSPGVAILEHLAIRVYP